MFTFWNEVHGGNLSIAAGLILRSLLCKKQSPDLSESVIPESFYRESRQDQN